MIKLFTALSLPENLRQRLHIMQGGVMGARWMEMEKLHITLQFIGEVDEDTAEDIDDVLSGIQAQKFSLSLQGTGLFEQGDDPRVLWMGVAPSEPLMHLKEKIDRQLDMRHLPFEKRKYVPHVTMAQLKDPDEMKLAEFMQTHNLFNSDPFEVNGFILYESRKTKNGTVFDPLRIYPLT